MRVFIFSSLIMLFIGCENTNKTTTMNDDSFIAIPGGVYYTERDSFSLDDFEIMPHPFTNAQYKAFTDATGYPAPLHRRNGKIPDSKEDYPVIYVNRDDMDTFLVWLNSNSDRNYRLPTSHEFRIAALGGEESGKYYWGNEELKLDTSLINFDPNENRPFDKWEKYLKPAIWGMQNDFGLYQMAGNIWRLISDDLDPEMATCKFRIETHSSNKRYIMGGSWASPKEYMTLGNTIYNSPGLRYPDLGYRLVRDPENANRVKKNRNIAPVMNSLGAVSISWSVLNSDKEDIRFNIYRLIGSNRAHSGFKLNYAPLIITSSYPASFQIVPGTRYQYKVTALDKNGIETDYSEWIGITSSEEQYPVIVKFQPLLVKGGMMPVFADLEGWSRRGCVIRLDNDNKKTSQYTGIPVQLEAFSSTGKSLWRKNIARHNNIFGSASNATFNMCDMDGDGKDEVIPLLQVGDKNNLAILNGMSGDLLYKTPWDPMSTDFSRSSTRIQMSVAYRDGKIPEVITQTGNHKNEKNL